MPADTPSATPGRKYVRLNDDEVDMIEAIWPREKWEKEETVPGVAQIRQQLKDH